MQNWSNEKKVWLRKNLYNFLTVDNYHDKHQDQMPQADPMAEDWASKNTWFGRDRPMTFTAFEIHKDLVEKEGFDPKSDEYYAEIDKRIKVDFPHKFGNSGDTTTS